MKLTQEQLRIILKKGNKLRKYDMDNETTTAYGVGILIISCFVLLTLIIF